MLHAGHRAAIPETGHAVAINRDALREAASGDGGGRRSIKNPCTLFAPVSRSHASPNSSFLG